MKYSMLTNEQFDEYYQIILDHFPKKEVKDYEHLKDLYTSKKLEVLTLEENGKLVGILSYFNLQELVFVDYFAIIEEYQGSGLGQKMLDHFKNTVKVPIILEVELPDTIQAERRIAFYQRQGLHLNTYPYVVPVVRDMEVELYFHLMSYPNALTKEEYEELYPKILDKVYQTTK